MQVMQKTIIAVLLTTALCIAAFFIGRQTVLSRIIVYRDYDPLGNPHTVPYPRDWPTYGLPLAEYTLLIRELEEKHIDRAKGRIEDFLDRVISDAEHRWAIAPAEDRKILQRPLYTVAEYRKQNPRPLVKNNVNHRSWQEGIDAFLARIREMGSPFHEDNSSQTHTR